MQRSQPSVLVPALIGGGASGVLSALPLVGALNLCCCSLVIGGGFLASFLYSKECRKADVAFQAGTGAKAGVVAGVFHGLAGAILALLPLAPSADEVIEQLRAFDVRIPPEAMPYIEMSQSLGVRFAMSLVFGLIFGCIFATIGGLIGGAAFKFEPSTTTVPPEGPPVG